MCMRGGRWFWAFKEDMCWVGGRMSMEAYPDFIIGMSGRFGGMALSV